MNTTVTDCLERKPGEQYARINTSVTAGPDLEFVEATGTVMQAKS